MPAARSAAIRCTVTSGPATASSTSLARTEPEPGPPPGTSTSTEPVGGVSRAARPPRIPSHTWSGSAQTGPEPGPAAYSSWPSAVSRKTGLAAKSARMPSTCGTPPPPRSASVHLRCTSSACRSSA